MESELPRAEAEVTAVNCGICRHGEAVDGETTVALEHTGMVLVVHHVPARICDNCGERYVAEAVTTRLLTWAQDAVRAGVQVEVRAHLAA